MFKQKEAFLKQEGDQYFERNKDFNPLVFYHQYYGAPLETTI
jgi:hypothetical protein